MIEVNKRVFHRYADLYGVVRRFNDDGTIAFIEYEWPYDPAAPPVPVPVEDLQDLSSDPYEKWAT